MASDAPYRSDMTCSGELCHLTDLTLRVSIGSGSTFGYPHTTHANDNTDSNVALYHNGYTERTCNVVRLSGTWISIQYISLKRQSPLTAKVHGND